MKNYKMLIISLLLLIFIIGAVSAADGNAILSDGDDGPGIVVGPGDDDDDDDDGPGIVVGPGDDDDDDDDEYAVRFEANNTEVFYGENKNFTARFLDLNNNNPKSDFPITFVVTDKNWETGFTKEYPSITDQNGFASFLIDLPVGEYGINYRLANGAMGFKIKITLSVLPTPTTTVLVENITDIKSTFSVNFTDNYGNILNNTTVLFKIGNDTINVTTDENGVATFDLSTLGLGEFNITIINPVTGQNVTKSVSLTTNETLFADDIAAVFNDGLKFGVKFTDKYGKALANTKVAFRVNALLINATTDENGIAFLSNDFKAGNYILSILNPVTGEEMNKTVTISKANTVLKATDVNMVFNVPKATVITLTDANGNAISNAKITINLNGKSTQLTTDKNGQAKLAIKLPAKKYTATIIYNGDDNHIKSTTTAKVVVKKASPKIIAKKKAFKAKTKIKKYIITLKDNKGKAFKKAKVTLKVKGKTYKAITNSKGKATFKITKLTKKGKYAAKVKFAGNTNFKTVTKSVKLTVK